MNQGTNTKQSHHGRFGMTVVTSVAMLATAAITDNIHNPKLRMACLLGCTALVSLAREAMWQHRLKEKEGRSR